MLSVFVKLYFCFPGASFKAHLYEALVLQYIS